MDSSSLGMAKTEAIQRQVQFASLIISSLSHYGFSVSTSTSRHSLESNQRIMKLQRMLPDFLWPDRETNQLCFPMHPEIVTAAVIPFTFGVEIFASLFSRKYFVFRSI
jgi:mitochondrial fission protein ELM1